MSGKPSASDLRGFRFSRAVYITLGITEMLGFGSQALIAGAAFSALAAIAHLACIIIGGPAYRFMGAGERMARAAEAGKLRPTLVTLFVALMLFAWSAYALSGAGVIAPLPQTKVALALICAVYIGRAVGFPLLRPAFPENSGTFWFVSSTICGVIGLVHVWGTLLSWHAL